MGFCLIVYFTKSQGVSGVIIGYSLYYLIANLLLVYYLLKETKKMQIYFNFTDLKNTSIKFLNLSFPAFISGSIGGPTIWLLYAIVANMPNGIIYIGIFNAAKLSLIHI